MRKERKIVWVYPSENKMRCPVRIIDKYISLLPPVHAKRKANFYLRSLEKYTHAQWYGEQVVGLCTIRKIMSESAKKANIQGFFTNHSLKHSGTTRLFQAGLDKKLIKEFTGHRSDAVDLYQETSDKQRQEISAIIAGQDVIKSSEVNVQNELNDKCEVEVTVDEKSDKGKIGCSWPRCEMLVSDANQIGKFITEIIEKLQIEIDC